MCFIALTLLTFSLLLNAWSNSILILLFVVWFYDSFVYVGCFLIVFCHFSLFLSCQIQSFIPISFSKSLVCCLVYILACLNAFIIALKSCHNRFCHPCSFKSCFLVGLLCVHILLYYYHYFGMHTHSHRGKRLSTKLVGHRQAGSCFQNLREKSWKAGSCQK